MVRAASRRDPDTADRGGQELGDGAGIAIIGEFACALAADDGRRERVEAALLIGGQSGFDLGVVRREFHDRIDDEAARRFGVGCVGGPVQDGADPLLAGASLSRRSNRGAFFMVM